MKPHPDLLRETGKAVLFQGFEYPWANFTYTPNQLFDVCLPHYSRGVVRLVAYMIRQTLGYMDADGEPLRRKVAVTYSELEERAGIGHSAIRDALDEAVAGNFIQCVEVGHRHSQGRVARSASYELRWDDRPEYTKNPKLFRGFFEGDGNRTNIPNQFFDVVAPTESLTVIKVVASVIRFSIGYQAKKGGRRQQVALSYKDIQRYARISSPRHLSKAIQEALRANYLRVVEEGVFDPEAGRRSKSAIYAIKWLEIKASGGITPKREAGNYTGNRTEKGSGNTPKREADNRTEKGSDIQTTVRKETLKQQQLTDAAAEGFLALKEIGFDEPTARRLSSLTAADQIIQQIEWLPRRGATVNPLGMLRRAIEEGWGEPSAEVGISQLSEDDPPVVFVKNFYAEYNLYEGAPTAMPSVADIEAARRYVAVLLGLWPDRSRVSVWGRAFGKLCLSFDQGRGIKQRTLVSCAAMLRSHGDEFVGRTMTAKKNLHRQVEENERRAYEEQHRPAYGVFLDELMARYEIEESEKYQAFEARRLEKRRAVEIWPKGSAKDRLLGLHDSPQGRRSDFVEFFSAEIPDFWAWDRQHNARVLS